MDSEFTMLLRRFIACYESDPTSLDVGLQQTEDGIAAIAEENSYPDESKAKRVSQKRTKQAMKRRLLAIPEEDETGKCDLDRKNANETTRRVRDLSWESYQQEQIDRFFDALAAEFEMSTKELDDFFRENNLSKDLLPHLMRDPNWLAVEYKHRFDADSKPNFHVFFAKEFLSWLDSAVAQVEHFEEVPYRKSIPLHLRQFLGEAYRCYLYGLDAACAALCGAILQEAIRIKMNQVGFSGLAEAIEDARAGAVLTDKAADAAIEIKRLRDFAAHGSQKFNDSYQHERKYVLSATREILDTLFAFED